MLVTKTTNHMFSVQHSNQSPAYSVRTAAEIVAHQRMKPVGLLDP